eukprot:CAMPEP_0198149776 /NCGR_PEP_ID=MMETSP1443-20131203/48125_1 /TAXON_ID=186043 /ORGANISM="Entomoneis sp., Strain CCMP2396" /LENGTH=65 /DNA_ID=CAMNT_0043814903 /DNA_START=430 /DNA_END=624 /DNA_ORIENTATION=-
MSPLPKTVQDAMKRERHDLDEQRNKSMRKRGRRTQYHRQRVATGEYASGQAAGDDFSAASSMYTE